MANCDLCGWPIEEWQPRPGEVIPEGFSDAGVIVSIEDVLRHKNPGDCRPTQKPESFPIDRTLSVIEVGDY